MSKRALLTCIIPALLISGLIIFLRNNPQEPAPELLLHPQHIDWGCKPRLQLIIED